MAGRGKYWYLWGLKPKMTEGDLSVHWGKELHSVSIHNIKTAAAATVTSKTHLLPCLTAIGKEKVRLLGQKESALLPFNSQHTFLAVTPTKINGMNTSKNELLEADLIEINGTGIKTQAFSSKVQIRQTRNPSEYRPWPDSFSNSFGGTPTSTSTIRSFFCKRKIPP